MKLSDLPYQRPELEATLSRLGALAEQLNGAQSDAEALAVAKEAVNFFHMIRSQYSLCSIRHTIDTRDAFYKAEMDYFDEALPAFLETGKQVQLALLTSAYRPYLESVIGKHAFDLIELETKTISEAVIDDLVKENQLTSEYTRLLASAQLSFDGKTLTLAQMGPYLESTSRDTRRAAARTIFEFYQDNDETLDTLFDDLVHVRAAIAEKLGFKSFTELGYARMGRTDYDSNMVAAYREQVLRTIVPLAAKLREAQRKRLGIDTLYYYDELIGDPKGNPKPLGDADKLLEDASVMFRELSPEADRFFSFMKTSEAMDLLAKPGKASGGYCTFLPDWKMPFIFANFNGTKGDVEVFTHEGGHAYQAYVTREDEWHNFHEAGMETCEIHSMSMEFLTWPWMDRFFGKDADRFRYHHLADALLFIPYGVAVDHYQHLVYANPEASPDARKQCWLDVEKMYLPWRNYADNAYLAEGNVWKRQLHIYEAPFYYIDYTLAQVLAFWFLQQALLDPADAWDRYDRICRDSGHLPFRSLLEAHGLPNPFEPGSLARFMPAIEAQLEALDPPEN